MPAEVHVSTESGTKKGFDGDETIAAAEPMQVSDRGIIASIISLSEESVNNKNGGEIGNLYLLIAAVLSTCIVGMLGCFVYSRVKKLVRRKPKQNEVVVPDCHHPPSPLPMDSNNFVDAESIERHVLNNVLGQLKYHIEQDDTMKRRQKQGTKGRGKKIKENLARGVDATHENNQCVLKIPIPGWCNDNAHTQHRQMKAIEDDGSSSDESSSGHEEPIFAVANFANAADAVLQASDGFIQDVQASFANDADDGSELSWFSVGFSKNQKKAGIKFPSRGPRTTIGRKLPQQRGQTPHKKRTDACQVRQISGTNRKLEHHPPALRPPKFTNTSKSIYANKRAGTRALHVDQPFPALEASKTWERSIDTRRPKVYSINHMRTKKTTGQKSLFK